MEIPRPDQETAHPGLSAPAARAAAGAGARRRGEFRPEAREGELDRQRRELRRQSDCRFVDALTFHKLLVSNRPLQREDHPGAGLRGLRESGSSLLFVIEEEQVFTPLRD
jgi:hypothetical protein